jgi:PleD family two-component response regulator
MQQTIMIVDDSIPLHRLIKAQLEADDLTFHSVYDGSDAVAAAASMKPDLILLDIDMPRMDGFEACQRIKADPATAAIPLMFLSAESTAEDKKKAMALGAFGFIQKPFKPEQLKFAVRSKLQATQAANKNAQIDLVTGLWGKEYFELQVREQYVLSSLSAEPLSCAIAEIDQLASLTVRFGSKTAGRAVHAVARILSDSSSPDATVCILPNRQFAILYRNCDRFEAKIRCKALQQQINKAVVIESAPEIKLTCSFGICDDEIASAMSLIDRTASVLHRALDHGGNRIALARSESLNFFPSPLH